MNANLWFIHGVTFFLAISLYLYLLLGGADFGAGILEMFWGNHRKSEKQQLITSALGPVWESNHIWLILVIVILFNGFPGAFSIICIYLHVPLTLLLVGIVFRGCSFTFRHYDAVKDRAHTYYTRIFAISSLLTPFMLGVIAGAIILGHIPTQPITYFAAYVLPWCNGFSFSLGLFVCCLFSFIAAVYLTGETTDPELRTDLILRAKIMGSLSVISGMIVFGVALALHLPWLYKFFNHPFSIGCIGVATILFFPLGFALKALHSWVCRILVSAQMGLILFGWLSIQFPVIIQLDQGAIDLYQSAAPNATLKYLLYALLVGSGLIFPALIYLLKIFKSKPSL